ncbi:hypothetical protein BDZ45DRAFT_697170 [Acephala macrosclerotiorum]|nr:hypothetical protein BDZ45DRAFT_697170 [Acephala macrosclerotiorum]
MARGEAERAAAKAEKLRDYLRSHDCPVPTDRKPISANLQRVIEREDYDWVKAVESQQSTKGEFQQPTKEAIATPQDKLLDRRLDRQKTLLDYQKTFLDRQDALLDRQEALQTLSNRQQVQAPMQVQALAQDRQYQGHLPLHLRQSVPAHLNYPKW